MNLKRRIFLCGNSVILGTVGASLRCFPQYEVTTLSSTVLEAKELKEMAPDAILFDLEATHPEIAFSWLEDCPSLLLIGISRETNLVRVWSGKQLQELSTQGLLNVINQQLNTPSVRPSDNAQ